MKEKDAPKHERLTVTTLWARPFDDSKVPRFVGLPGINEALPLLT